MTATGSGAFLGWLLSKYLSGPRYAFEPQGPIIMSTTLNSSQMPPGTKNPDTWFKSEIVRKFPTAHDIEMINHYQEAGQAPGFEMYVYQWRVR